VKRHRWSAAAGVLILAALSGIPLTALAPTTAPAAAAANSGTTITLTRLTPVSPSTDLASQSDPVTFVATIANNSDTEYTDFTVGLERAAPITDQAGLDAAIATPPTGNTLADPHYLDQHRALAAHSSTTVTYVSDASAANMCLCFTGVYPFALIVRAQVDTQSGFDEIARTQVLIPSFLAKPQPVKVAWVWPLLERPHRNMGDAIFTDDDLASSVAPGGRLFRALQVAQSTVGRVRMSLLVDPDLIDSLAVMAAPEGYTYRSGDEVLRGRGGQSAKIWLSRFQAVAAKDDVSLSGYADPDVNAVTRAGMPFSTALDPQVRLRISPYFPAGLNNDLSWPAGSALTSKALDATIASGSSVVVLSDAALPGQNHSLTRADALSPLPSANGSGTALVTDAAIEKTVGQLLTASAPTAQALQTLLGQLAMRAVADPEHSHFVALTPNRDLDVDPGTATATILATTSNSWSAPISVPLAVQTVQPVDRGALQTSAESASAEVSPAQLNQLNLVSSQVASLREALNSNAAAQLLGGFSSGLQRGQSNAWRSDRARGQALADELSKNINGRLGSVSLIQPADGTYSLSSATAPVVVNVVNKLNQDVAVRVTVQAPPNVVGFAAKAQFETIPANGRKQIQLPTHVERLGQFRVVATLTTPDGLQLGDTVQLRLRVTAIGGITKTITIVAATVLVLALIRRFVKRIRLHRANRAGGAAA
jgi:hypothetical protein